jgi:hypothetical protein
MKGESMRKAGAILAGPLADAAPPHTLSLSPAEMKYGSESVNSPNKIRTNENVSPARYVVLTERSGSMM